jgi:hypothetical protein
MERVLHSTVKEDILCLVVLQQKNDEEFDRLYLHWDLHHRVTTLLDRYNSSFDPIHYQLSLVGL